MNPPAAGTPGPPPAGAPAPGGAPTAHRPLLLQRDFAALWWGQLISLWGDRLNYLALNGLVQEHTRDYLDPGQSSLMLSLHGTVSVLPVLLFSPFAGPWVDRWNLRKVLIVSDLLRALLVFTIPYAYAATHHAAPVWGIVFLMFTCNVFFLPAKSAMTPEIVPREQLLGANTLLAIAGIVGTVLGFATGGWIVDRWGWPVGLTMNAVTYGVSVVSLAYIRYRPHPHAAGGPAPARYWHEIVEGLAIVRRSPSVRLAIIALSAVWVGGGFVQVAGIQHIQRAASIPGAERIAGLGGALGVGAALATWWLNTHGRRRSPARVLGIGMVLAGAWLVCLAASSRFAVFAGASFLIGACIAPAFVLTEMLLQEGADVRQRGRVFSLRDFVMRSLLLVSMGIATLLTPRLGTAATLVVAAGLMATAGVLSILGGRELDARRERSAGG
jgi:MFS family permease